MMRLTFGNQMERRKGSKSFNKEADIKPFCIHLSQYSLQNSFNCTCQSLCAT